MIYYYRLTKYPLISNKMQINLGYVKEYAKFIEITNENNKIMIKYYLNIFITK